METQAQTPETSKVAGETSPPPKNPLGISKTVYALGYSFQQAMVWGTAVTVAMMGIIGLGVKKDIPAVKWFISKVRGSHNWWKNTPVGKFFDGPVIAASLAVGWISGHIIQASTGLAGWKKASAAIQRHDQALEENASLERRTTLLKEESAHLREVLDRAREAHVPYTETVRAGQETREASR